MGGAKNVPTTVQHTVQRFSPKFSGNWRNRRYKTFMQFINFWRVTEQFNKISIVNGQTCFQTYKISLFPLFYQKINSFQLVTFERNVSLLCVSFSVDCSSQTWDQGADCHSGHGLSDSHVRSVEGIGVVQSEVQRTVLCWIPSPHVTEQGLHDPNHQLHAQRRANSSSSSKR